MNSNQLVRCFDFSWRILLRWSGGITFLAGDIHCKNFGKQKHFYHLSRRDSRFFGKIWKLFKQIQFRKNYQQCLILDHSYQFLVSIKQSSNQRLKKILFIKENSGVSFAVESLRQFLQEFKFFRDEAWDMTNSK